MSAIYTKGASYLTNIAPYNIIEQLAEFLNKLQHT